MLQNTRSNALVERWSGTPETPAALDANPFSYEKEQ
jgi:hypothetical protein